MSDSNFDKNGLDKSDTHWLQYAAFVVTAFHPIKSERNDELINFLQRE